MTGDVLKKKNLVFHFQTLFLKHRAQVMLLFSDRAETQRTV